MKLTKRAQGLFPAWYKAEPIKALQVLAAFAAQNPGIDPRDYFNSWGDEAGIKAYRAECRAVARDLARVRRAMDLAVHMQVTEQQIMDACDRAFSGRLQMQRNGQILKIDYCTGPYWPTEYRKAAACVLEEAAHISGREMAAAKAQEVNDTSKEKG